MTRASAYPVPAAELVERVRALAVELGEWPSQRRVARTCRVGTPRAAAALDALRREGFEPVPTRALHVVPAPAERVEDGPQLHPADEETGAPDDAAQGRADGAESAVEPLITGPAGAVRPRRARRVPRWPLLVIAAGAFVSIWGGWVGLGELAGFGPVRLLPGIADSFVINSAITLPLGVEAYAAYALWVWLAPPDARVSDRARRFACWSSIAALGLGVFGQATYHLLVTAGVRVAPWPVVTFVSCLPVPVLVLGAGAALAHLTHAGEES